MTQAKVVLNLGGLNIRIEQDVAYPDQLTDMCNRAAILCGTAIAQAKAADINIMASVFVDYGDDDDEEEDA
jgi:hypothetical protein